MDNRMNMNEFGRQMRNVGGVEVLVELGIHSGEISGLQARRVFKTHFLKLVSSGRLKPVRVGQGVKATKWYSVKEIHRLLAMDALDMDATTDETN